MELEEITKNINTGIRSIEKHLDVFTEQEKEDYHYMINNIEVLIKKARKKSNEKIYFKCPKCKRIIERSKDNPFIKWRFLHLFCESYCEKHGEKVLMRRVL